MSDFAARVVGAATTGAVGAVVAASLSAVTEPIVNRVLVKREPLTVALANLDLANVLKFFNTTIITNFIKFPFFEVTNVVLGDIKDLSPTAKGALTGAVFCTLTLPITNYRFRKSMNLPVDPKALYQAYLPTVMRDIIYGTVRTLVTNHIRANNKDIDKTTFGKFYLSAVAVLVACVVSAPGNEVRGYYLQPEKDRKPVKEFFQPEKFIRSTSIGAMIMSVAMGIGAIATAPASDMTNNLRAWMKSNQMETIVALFVLNRILDSRASA